MTQTSPSAKAALAALCRPGVAALPEPPAPIRWTRRRWLLLGAALLCSAYFFTTVIGNNWTYVQAFFQLRDRPLEITWAPATEKEAFWENLSLLAAGVTVLLCLWGIAGSRAVGLSGGVKNHSIALGYYLRAVYPISLVLLLVTPILLKRLPFLQNYTGYLGVNTPHETGHVAGKVFLSFAAGITEEIIVTVFLYWLLERIRLRGGSTTLAATGWGMAVMIVAQLSYHMYHGIRAWWMIAATLLTVICWRYTRSLVALIVGHIGWDLIDMIPNISLWYYTLLGLAAVGCLLDWRAVRPAFACFFPFGRFTA